MSTEHKQETGASLLNCEASSLIWRSSVTIYTSDLFSRLKAKLTTLNGTEWTTIVYKTRIANCGRPFRWPIYCRCMCKNVYSYKNRIIAKILGLYILPPIARIFHSFLSLSLASNLNIELTPPLAVVSLLLQL
jgi:hypothetical protein